MKPISLKVLSFEDSPEDLLLLEHALEQDALNRFTLTHVERLQDGLKLLKRRKFDAILLDLDLPDSHGLATFEQVFQHAGEIPIVICSGNTDESDAVTAVRKGAQDYLVKGMAGFAFAPRTIRHAVERSKLAQTVQESEARYHSLFDHSMDAILLTRPQGEILAANSSACQLFGYSEAELRRIGRQGLMEASDPHWQLALTAREQTGFFRGELTFKRRDGSTFVGEISSKIFADKDGLPTTSILIRDTTDRKQSEKLVKQWADAFENCAHGIAIGLPNTNQVLTCNSAFARQQGRTVEEISSMPILSMYAPQDHEHVKRSIATADQLGHVSYEAHMLRKDGHIYPVQMDVVSVKDEHGNILYRVATQQDITERKQAETELRESEVRFSTAFFTNPVSQSILSQTSGLTVEVNDACCRLFEYSREELVGGTPGSLDLWAYPDEQLASVDELQRSGHLLPKEIRIRTKSGEIRTVLFAVEPITWMGTPCLITSSIDITERKHAEEKIQESEERFRLLFETMSQGVIYHNADGRILSANPAAQKILGLSLEQMLDKGTGGPNWKVVHEDGSDFSTAQQPVVRALQTGQPVFATIMGISGPATQGQRWLSVNATPQFRPGESQPYQVYTMLEDITERRRAEHQIRESENRYRNLFEDSPVAIWEDDFSAVKLRLEQLQADGYDLETYFDEQPEEIFRCFELIKVLDVNKAAVQLYEANDKTQLIREIGKTIHQGFHEHFKEQFKAQLLAAIRGETYYQTETIRQTFKGQIRNVQLTWAVSPGYEQTLSRVLVSLMDITGIKQAEARLIQSEERHRLISEMSSDYVYESQVLLPSRESKTVWISGAFEQITGHSAQTVLEQPNGFVELVHPDDLAHLATQMEMIMQSGMGVFEYRIVRKDGGVRWLRDHIKFITEDQGQSPVFRIFGAVDDITERKLAEESLRASQRQMQALVSSLDDIVFEVDRNGTYLNLWTANEAILFAPREAVIGKRFDEVFGPEASRPFFDFLTRVLESDKPQTLEYPVEIGGAQRWFAAQYSPIHDAGQAVTSVSILVRDVTERKQAEAALRRSEALLAEAQRIGHIGHLEWISHKAELVCSAELHKILGLAPEAKITKDTIANMLAAGEHERLTQLDHEAFARRGNTDYEYRIHLPDGSERWLRQQSNLTYDERGAPVRMLAICQDITRQKAAEIQLRESQTRSQAMLDAIPDLMFRLDRQGVFLDYKAEVHQLYDQGRPTLVGLCNRDIAPPEFADLIEQKISETLATGQLQTFEYQLPVPGQGLQEYEARMSPSGPDEVIAVVRNITKRKLADQALKISEENYRSLVENSDSAIAVLGREGHILYSNARGIAIWQDPEIVGKTIHEVYPPEYVSRYLPVIQSVIDTGLSLTDEIESPVGGQVRWFRISMSALKDPDGSVNSLLLNAWDITERKQVEIALQEKLKLQEQLEKTASIVPGMLHIFKQDPSGINSMPYASPVIRDLYGLEPADVVNDMSPAFAHIDPQDLAHIQASVAESARTMTPWRDEFRYHHPEKGLRWYSGQSTPVAEADGSILWYGIIEDVTGRKDAEEERHKAELLLRTVLNNAPITLFALDAQGRFTLSEGKELESVGLKPGENVGVFALDLYASLPYVEHNGNLTNGRDILQRALSGETVKATNEFNNVHFDHSLDGTVRKVAIYGRDITARKQTEERLRQSEAGLAEAQRIAKLGNWRFDIATNTVTWSDELYKIFDVDKEAFGSLYDSFLSHVYPEDRAIVLAANQHTRESGEPFEIEYRIATGASAERHIHEIGHALKDEAGRVTGMFGIAQDITAQAEAEKLLKASEARFREIADHINEVFWVFDNQQGRLAYLSPAFARIWGCDIEATYANNQLYVNAIHPEDRGIMFAALERQAQGQQTEMEYRVVRPDGSTSWIMDRSFPIHDSEGRLVRTTGIASDITERKRSEALIYAQRDLAMAIGRFSTPADGYRVCLETLFQLTGLDSGGLYLFDEPRRNIEMVYYHGLSDAFATAFSRFPAEAPNVQMILNGHAAYFSNTDPVLENGLHQQEGLQALASVPVQYQGEVIGCLNLSSHTLAEVPEYARQILETLAIEIGNFIIYLRAQETLRASEEKLRSLVESQTHFVTRVNLAGHFTYWNETYHNEFGWLHPEDDLSKANPLASICEYHHERTRATIEKCIAQPGLVQRIELDKPGRDGSIRTSLWEFVCLTNAKGEPTEIQCMGLEITERIKAERELMASEEKYRRLSEELEQRVQARTAEVQDLYENAPIGYHSLDAEGRLVMVNQTELKWLGYPREALLGHSLTEFLTDESLAIFRQNFPAFKRQGFLNDLELEFICHDGTSIPTLVNAVAIYDEAGNYLMSRSAIFNNSERKRAEVALRESRESLQHFFDTASDLIQSMDETGRYLYVNAAWSKTLGYTPEEASRLSMMEVVDPSLHEHCRAMLQTLMADQSPQQLEVIFRTKEGQRVVVEGNISSRMDKAGHIATNGIFRNITERKLAEQTLRESNEQNRLLFESSPDAVVLFDAQGQIVRMNHSFELLSGLSIEQGIGHTIDTLGLLPTEQMEQLATAVTQAFLQANEYASTDFKIQRRSGELRNVSVRVYGVPLQGQQHFLASMRDITAEKLAEDAVRMANVELERALRMKDEFLANMSHELRTPLNAILGLSESLLEETAGPLNEKQVRYLGTVSESGKHLLELINDILDLAKVESGQIQLDLQPVSIQGVFEASLRMIKQLAQKKNQTVSMDLADEVGLVRADERRLKQMIVNLLSNAVKFTPENGRLGLEARLDPETTHLLITVWDEGIGIAEQDLKRLFQPFVQLDSRLARENAGTGLGLALVAEMARLHGGSIQVVSAPGRGSRFILTLPWEPNLELEPGERLKATGHFHPVLEQPANERPLILLVEDTDHVVMMVADYLELAGYNVEVARNGLDGIRQARALRPALIIMDVQMPGMDGLEATRRIRQEPALHHTPILALTALAMPSDRERCLAAGMNDYISKPVNLKQLVRTIGLHLARNKDSGE